MSEIYHEKIVDFQKWCPTCKYRDMKDIEEPCTNCLEHAVNANSTKPIMWKEKDHGTGN